MAVEARTVSTEFPSATADTDVAVETIAGVDYQYVKACFGEVDTVTIASATNPLPVTLPASAAVNQTVNTLVSVPTTAGGTEVLAANATRKGLLLMSDTLFYVAVGADPTTSSWPVQPGQFWSPPVNMTGQVKCLSSSGTINVSVFEC